MAMTADQRSGQVRTSVRKVRRVEGEQLPFVPYGVLPLLGLCALMLIGMTSCAHSIRTAASEAADAALSEVGADWAEARVDGQWITLEGRPPTPAAAIAAESAVRSAKASTWLGRAEPVTRVRTAFGPALKASEDVPAATPEPEILPDADTPAGDATPAERDAAVEETVTAHSPAWNFRLRSGTLRLAGEIPDRTTRQSILDAANATVSPPDITNVEDRMVVTDQPAPVGYRDMAVRGVRALSRCDSGTATFVDSVFSLNCELPQSAVASVRAIASAGASFGEVGTINLLANEAVSACETSLTDLLGNAQINFSSGSAVINPSSTVLLDQIAEAAGTCPGVLRIEGHTDNTGQVATNVELSRERADAVRAALVRRGVDQDRLIAQGFGSSQPVSNNVTPEGRARNRRIEIKVVRDADD
ncbi:MAG: OmpA family protein [Pseudomonadota bacterium]